MNLIMEKTPFTIEDEQNQISYFLPRNHGMSVDLNKLSLISLFTGGGGLDLGLEWAGFQTRCFVEKDKYCIDTIKKNRNWPLVGDGDITKISSKDILKVAGLKRGEAALVAGGAPCQPFSNLGKKDGEENINGQLYKYFIEVVQDIQPAMFLFENVRGIMQNHHKVIPFMNSEFGKIGYKLSTALLCAADYGVPQKRFRIFVIGTRSDIDPGFPFPTHAEDPEIAMDYLIQKSKEQGVSLSIQNLRKWVTVGEIFAKIKPYHYTRKDNFTAKLAPHIINMIRHIKPGTKMCWRDLPDELKFNCWKKGNFQGSDNFSRLLYNEPSVTIRTGAVYPAKGRYIHPNHNRGLNTVELAALQSFPLTSDLKSGWFFSGGITSITRQIGNAVPPLLAMRLGQSLISQIHQK